MSAEATGSPGLRNDEQRLKQETFVRLQHEAKTRPDRWAAGQYVALFDGNVVAASSDFAEAVRSLREVAPDRSQGMVFRIGDRYDETERML